MPEAELSERPRRPRERGHLSLRDIDPDAFKVVRKLLAGGHEAYLVGGCVRDLYLRRKPKDFDVATSATPEAIRKTFRNSRIIGRRFRLAHVFFGPKIIETSTFRTAPTSRGDDDRLITHDNEWGSIEDDARRRDFTINGLFFDIPSNTIVDFVDGLHDLDRGVIRTIGDPIVRFQEDPVRMIRAVKFAARLDFTIEPSTWRALLDTTDDITKCSRARVLEELYKILRGGASRRSLELMLEAGLLPAITPEYMTLHDAHLRTASPNPNGASRKRRARIDPRLWELLDALDEYTIETHQVAGNGVLLALLFAPLVKDEWAASPRTTFDRKLERLMLDFCVSLGVARRDRELARQILMAHHHTIEPQELSSASSTSGANPSAGGSDASGGGRRRRRRPSLVQRQYFHDALVFLGITVRARGSDGSELQYWQKLASAQRSRAAEPHSRGPKKRRHRGRSRKRTANADKDTNPAGDEPRSDPTWRSRGRRLDGPRSGFVGPVPREPARERRERARALLRHGTSDHYLDAELYDFEYRDRIGDVLWYRSLARRTCGNVQDKIPRILELGAGSGRVTIPLLADGHHVTAVDRMKPMLDALARKLERELAVSARPRLEIVLADMRALPLDDGVFDLVIAPFNTLQHLYTVDDLQRCFREVARVLAPGGAFAFDVMQPDLDWLLWDPDRRHAVTEFVHPRTGERMIYSTNHTYDHHTQVCHIRIYYDDAPTPRRDVPFTPPPEPRELVRLAHRQIFPEELRALLPAAGLTLDQLGGDFRGLRLTDETESIVVVCRKS